MGAALREFRRWIYRSGLDALPPAVAISIQFWRTQARLPSLRHPQSFNEKVQWRKLHDRRAILAEIIDKVRVKSLLAERFEVGNWIIPTLWTGERLSAGVLKGMAVPYIIKPNHTSGVSLVNLGDASDLDALADQANEMVAARHPRFLHEWPYAQIKPQLLVEPFIGVGGQAPNDYKLFVFQGCTRIIQVDTDRDTKHRRALYDRQWRRLKFQYGVVEQQPAVAAPSQLGRMIAFAERVAKELGLEFIRVDLYEVDGRAYFGELTPFPASGYARFTPRGADFEVGRLWRLPHGSGPAAFRLRPGVFEAPADEPATARQDAASPL